MERNIKLDKETFIKLMTFFKTWTKTAEKKSQAIADVLWSKNMFSLLGILKRCSLIQKLKTFY